MESRKIEGQLAVRGLLGNGWVYLSATENGLRLVNVPSWVDADAVRDTLTGHDDVGPISVHEGRGRVRIAHAVLDANIVTKILRAPARSLEAVEAPPPVDVLQEWLAQYDRERDTKAVRAWADAAMETYEMRERKREEARKRALEQGADSDGFVKIVGGPSVEEADHAKVRRGISGVEKDGFYRWQKKRKADLNGLRERFEQDRKRVRAAAGLKLNK